jgi:hypothetical protein
VVQLQPPTAKAKRARKRLQARFQLGMLKVRKTTI